MNSQAFDESLIIAKKIVTFFESKLIGSVLLLDIGLEKSLINDIDIAISERNLFKIKEYLQDNGYIETRADYNDNILLLMPRVEFGKVRGVKITNFDTVPYTECSIDFLQRRVKLICQFDGLCDNIVSEYYNMISKFKKEVCKYGK